MKHLAEYRDSEKAKRLATAPPRSLVWPVEAACWLRHHNESNQ